MLDFIQRHNQTLQITRSAQPHGLLGDVDETVATRRQQHHFFEGTAHKRRAHIRHIEFDLVALLREMAERLVQTAHRLAFALLLLDFLGVVRVRGDAGEVATRVDDLREELHVFALLTPNHDRIQ